MSWSLVVLNWQFQCLIFFFFDVILKTLKKICLQCSSLVSKKACHQCHAPTEKIRKKNTYTILHNQDPFTTSEIRLLFANLSFENAQKLGWNVPPVRAVPKILAVPPPCVRPSARMTNGKWCCSDLTYKYSEIIKVNNVLKSLVYGNYPKHIIMDSWIKLQWHVSTLFDNSAKDFNIANARRTLPVEGYKQRLSGKEGRIRCHLMGKRVDFSARTVITPDPNLDLDEVGVPKQIALSLTKPETVTSFNLEEMVQRIRAGPKSLQGAKYLIIKGQKFDLTVARIEKVSVGDIIERPLKNGDIVVMNHQPTLHKMSMMAHRVKIMVRSAMPFFVPQHTH